MKTHTDLTPGDLHKLNIFKLAFTCIQTEKQIFEIFLQNNLSTSNTCALTQDNKRNKDNWHAFHPEYLQEFSGTFQKR